MDELGDVLFTIVNISRFLKLSPEEAMIHANQKFKRRFSFVEKSVKDGRGNFADYTLDELEAFWKQAKEREDNMRLDKFLKVSRLIKRRTLAKQVADQGRITINGKVAKASSVVKESDELAIRFGQKIVTVKINIERYDEKRRCSLDVHNFERREA